MDCQWTPPRLAPLLAAPQRSSNSEEAIDAKDDNPDPALGAAGPSPLGMPEPSSGTGH